ncbi:MAG: D-aminoacyl-tRNA deacylase [Candidatus Bathyarchaeia archaeon]
MILIVASKKDIAGMNIAQQILSHYKLEKFSEPFDGNPAYIKRLQHSEVRMVFINVDSINTQAITDFFTPQLLIFLSRHSSTSGIPTLSVHTPGNLGEARFGGIPKRVSISPASTMKTALAEMARRKEKMELDYKVSYEATHHGPCLNVPCMFVEVGSSPKQWRDERAAEAVAHAAMAAASSQAKYPAALGIGGPHHNAKFTRIALTREVAFSHMIPKYAVPQLDVEIVEQCVERTVEEVESVILDWKGIRGADKKGLRTILDGIGLPVEKV